MMTEIVASILGGVAGAVAGAFAAAIDRRIHEGRRRVVAAYEQIDSIACDLNAQISAYWSNDGIDVSLQTGIISGFEKLRSKVRALNLPSQEQARTDLMLREIHHFATGGLFQSASRRRDVDRAREARLRIDSIVETARTQACG